MAFELLFFLYCCLSFFVHLIYLKHVSISKKMSPCGKTQIGNDIHFHLEGHIVVQTEVLQSYATGIKINFDGHIKIQ